MTRPLIGRAGADRRPSRTVAVVVPLSARAHLLPEEEVSLRHLCHYLGAHDKYLVAPSGQTVSRDGFSVVHFPGKFFGSASAFNSLIRWAPFYRRFQDYEYILMYHLDSLVFADELLQWCGKGFDFIGAPWIPCSDTPWVDEPRVGNGGFALMRVDTVLRVLHARHRTEPATYWSDMLARNERRLRPFYTALQAGPATLRRAPPISRLLTHWEAHQDPGTHAINNDYFWAFRANHYLPSFRVASVAEALPFAFEAAPQTCFEWNHRRMPFGCHAWAKFDRAFWTPHLLPEHHDDATS